MGFPDPEKSGLGVSTTEDNSTAIELAETPLERICTLPEHITHRELTTNQQRAHFIAREVRDYVEKAYAGLVLNSGTIAKDITAAEGTKLHTQTVARVMDCGLGDSTVEYRPADDAVVVTDSGVATEPATQDADETLITGPYLEPPK